MTGISGGERRMLADTVRRFVRREIWLWEKRIDPNAFTLPAEVAAALARKVTGMGLSLVHERAELGGPELDGPARALVVEEMAQHRAGALAPGYGLFGPEVPAALSAADAQQRKRFLRPLLRGEQRCFLNLDFAGRADAGVDTGGVRAPEVRIRARQRDDGWTLDGTKLFVAGAGTVDAGADFGVVYARTESAAGEGLGVSCFVVETNRPGFQRWRPYPTLALGRDTQELNLSNVRLPPENLLGGLGEGLRLGRPAWVRRDVFVAARTVGVGQAALAIARARARGGRAGESGRWALADGQMLLAGARALVQEAAGPAWELSEETEATDDSTGASAGASAGAPAGAPEAASAAGAAAAQARLAAQAAASQAVDGAMAALGPAGLSADLPLERWFRELRVMRASDGGAGRLREATARHLLSTYGP